MLTPVSSSFVYDSFYTAYAYFCMFIFVSFFLFKKKDIFLTSLTLHFFLSDCAGSGWNVLIYTSMSTLGDWMGAWRGAESLDDSAFLDAGGNGHSLSNTLWYISTRQDAIPSMPVVNKAPPADNA